MWVRTRSHNRFTITIPKPDRPVNEGDTAVCEVSDSGTGFPPSFTGLSGFGIVMVNLLCDLVRTHTSHSGTTVRVYLGR